MAKTKKRPSKSEKQESSKSRPSFSKPKLNLASETKRGIAVIIFLIAAGVIMLALIGVAGGVGTSLSRILAIMFGVMEYLVPLILVVIALSLYRQGPTTQEGDHLYFRTYLGAILLTGSIAGLIHLTFLNNDISAFSVANQGRGGGILGAVFSGPLHSGLGAWATGLILIGLLVIGISITFNIPPRLGWFKKRPVDPADAQAGDKIKINSMATSGFVKEAVVDKNAKLPDDVPEEEPLLSDEDAPPIEPLSTKVNTPKDQQIKLEAITLEDRRDWKLPPFDLLDDNKTEVDSGNIESNVAIIQKTLQDFGIEVEMGEVNVGPTVTNILCVRLLA